MIKIGLTGLAAYVEADDAGKRKVLQRHKYPNSRQRDYYREATNAAIRLHRGCSPDVILKEAADLEARALVAVTDQTRTALRHNARAIRELLAMVRDDIAPFERVERGPYLRLGRVTVAASPTMVVRSRRRCALVRMHFGVPALTDTEVKVITQSMFDAACTRGSALPSSAALIYDVHRGVIHRGSRRSSRMAAVLHAALTNIEILWPSIEPPRHPVRA